MFRGSRPEVFYKTGVLKNFSAAVAGFYKRTKFEICLQLTMKTPERRH